MLLRCQLTLSFIRQGGSWDEQALVQAVRSQAHSNPLAATLGLRSREEVEAFAAAQLPGLDLVLLSRR